MSYLHKIELRQDPKNLKSPFSKLPKGKDALARPISKWVTLRSKENFEGLVKVLLFSVKMSLSKNKFQLKLWKILKQFKTILQSDFSNGHLISKSVVQCASKYGRHSSKIAILICALFTILVTLWHKSVCDLK